MPLGCVSSQVVSAKLRPDQIASVGKLFDDMDKDGSRTVTIQELTDAFVRKGITCALC